MAEWVCALDGDRFSTVVVELGWWCGGWFGYVVRIVCLNLRQHTYEMDDTKTKVRPQKERPIRCAPRLYLGLVLGLGWKSKTKPKYTKYLDVFRYC